MKLNFKLYRSSCLLLTLLLTLLRCLSMTAFYNPQLGYFDNSFLPITMNVIYLLAALWFLSTLKLLPKGALRTDFTPEHSPFKWASGAGAGLLVLALILVFTSQSSSKFTPLILLTLALSTLFFISAFVNDTKIEVVRAFSSIAVIGLLMCTLAAIYFDLAIAMNSPHKVMGSFALMASMIFMLCETRVFLGKPLSRLHFATSLLTFTIGASMVLSSACYIIVASPSVFIKTPIILGNAGYLLVIAAISAYALARCFSFSDTAKEQDFADSTSEPAAEE